MILFTREEEKLPRNNEEDISLYKLDFVYNYLQFYSNFYVLIFQIISLDILTFHKIHDSLSRQLLKLFSFFLTKDHEHKKIGF